MSRVFDSSAAKKPTNLTVNSDLLSRARKLNINLSATLEKALVAELKNAEKQSWLKKNKKAISALNNFSEKNGLSGYLWPTTNTHKLTSSTCFLL